MPDWDNDELMDTDGGCYGNEPRILKDPGVPNAGKDGFTVVARRVRGDPAGEVTDADEADATEKRREEMDSMFAPKPGQSTIRGWY